MGHRARAGLAALIVAGLAPVAVAASGQPTLQTDAQCYLPDQAVQITGAGFAPGSTYRVTLDRQELGSGTTKADGTVSGTLSSGRLPSGRRTVRHRLQVFDGTAQGRTAFDVTAFRASFAPAAGDPHTLVVQYSVLGLGVGVPAGTIIYLHYVDPGGHLKGTLAIGRTAGRCGSLVASAHHRLFPFRTAAGTWRLQFDLTPGYAPGRRPRIVRNVTVA